MSTKLSVSVSFSSWLIYLRFIAIFFSLLSFRTFSHKIGSCIIAHVVVSMVLRLRVTSATVAVSVLCYSVTVDCDNIQ